MSKKYVNPGSKEYQKKIFFKLSKQVYKELKKEGVTWNQAQKITSLNLYKNYKTKRLSTIDKESRSINQKIKTYKKSYFEDFLVDQIETVPEECESVFKVPEADLIDIEWYDIGNVIRIIPNKVKIRVSAGQHGNTSIKFAEDLDYHAGGVAAIVNSIRSEVNNASGSDYIFTGIRQLIPGRKDDNTNCNYFIDFILEINGVLVSVIGPEIESSYIFELTEEEIKRRKISKKQAEKIAKQRRAEKKEENRLKKIEQEKIEKAKKRKRAKESPKTKEDAPSSVVFNLDTALDRLSKEYDKGIWSVADYKKERSRLIKLAEKISK